MFGNVTKKLQKAAFGARLWKPATAHFRIQITAFANAGHHVNCSWHLRFHSPHRPNASQPLSFLGFLRLHWRVKVFFSFYAFCFFQPPFALFSGCKNDFLCLLSSLETEHWYFVAVRGMKCFPAIHFLPPLAFFRQRLCGTAPCFWFTPISLTHSLAPLWHFGDFISFGLPQASQKYGAKKKAFCWKPKIPSPRNCRCPRLCRQEILAGKTDTRPFLVLFQGSFPQVRFPQIRAPGGGKKNLAMPKRQTQELFLAQYMAIGKVRMHEH